MADGGPQDPRLQYISDRVCTLLRSKDEYFRKLAEAEEGEVIKNFCNTDGTNRLFFTAGAKDMAVYENIPPNYKKEGLLCAENGGGEA